MGPYVSHTKKFSDLTGLQHSSTRPFIIIITKGWNQF